MQPLHIIFIVASISLLFFIWQRDRRRTSQQRARMFDLCLPLFEQLQITQRPNEFPSLKGQYRSEQFVLEAFPDTLGYRKFPTLWMQVTLTATLPINGTVDILARAQNIEFFSPANELDIALPIPVSWPQPIQFRTNNENHELDIAPIETNIATLFADNRIKELLVTARGLRMIYQLSQAEKSRYLVFRMAEFEEMMVNPEFLRELMDVLLNMREKISSRTEITQP
jgi:hypothetical protein